LIICLDQSKDQEPWTKQRHIEKQNNIRAVVYLIGEAIAVRYRQIRQLGHSWKEMQKATLGQIRWGQIEFIDSRCFPLRGQHGVIFNAYLLYEREGQSNVDFHREMVLTGVLKKKRLQFFATL
jgi:hypothetical protein